MNPTGEQNTPWVKLNRILWGACWANSQLNALHRDSKPLLDYCIWVIFCRWKTASRREALQCCMDSKENRGLVTFRKTLWAIKLTAWNSGKSQGVKSCMKQIITFWRTESCSETEKYLKPDRRRMNCTGSCCPRVHLMSYCMSQALNSHFTAPLLNTCKLHLAKD